MNDPAESGVLPLLRLVDHLRTRGLACPTPAVRLFTEALAETGTGSLTDIAAAARATLCSSREELVLLDSALSGGFDVEDSSRPNSSPQHVPTLPDHGADGPEAGDWALEGASLVEVQHRPIPLLQDSEQTAMLLLLDRIIRAPTTPRMFLSTLGRPHRADLHRVAQSIVKFDGDLPLIPYRRRASRSVDLHIAVDVSGSMKAYAPVLLTFALLLQQRYSGRTASFALGTDCLPLVQNAENNRSLKLGNSSPEHLLATARNVTAAHGGTNLGASLAALGNHAVKSRSNRRQLLVFSDGWDAGDPTSLRRAMIRLRRLYTTIVWANPHAAVPGYLPVQQGMAAVEPYLDCLVSGHSLASLEEVLALLASSVAAS